MINDRESSFNEVFKEYENREGFKIVEGKDILGKGAFGIVKLISYKKNFFAAKLVEKEKFDEMEYIKDLVGPHIIQIKKICSSINKLGKNYHLIIMEYAKWKDLSKLTRALHDRNFLDLIYKKCFDEECSDTLLRFFARQIIDGMMTLYQNNYVHFDIKPQNILVLHNCILKIADFGLLKKINDKVKEYKIPGGTKGYTTLEYLLDKRVNASEARAQDYFALGCILFTLKYGFPLLSNNNEDDIEILADNFIKLLDKNTNYIQSCKIVDKDFTSFLTNLIKFNPNERLKFEEIYRNKWVNKNVDIINKIVEDYERDDEKLIIDLQKQDFFRQKNEIFQNNYPHIDSNKRNKKFIRKCFRFKKKLKDK